jgi:Yippee zinc-binding/DNA-binding /Mis18, centromere assembly
MILEIPLEVPFKMPFLWLFQRFTEAQFEILQKDLEQQQQRHQAGQRIVCKVCQNVITSSDHRIEVLGQHRYLFRNPSGFVFDIGCFSEAPGCVRKGTLSLEYTWFKGYSWNFALCASCQMHLGWFYQSASEGGFYGLILENLEEEKSS